VRLCSAIITCDRIALDLDGCSGRSDRVSSALSIPWCGARSARHLLSAEATLMPVVHPTPENPAGIPAQHWRVETARVRRLGDHGLGAPSAEVSARWQTRGFNENELSRAS